MNSVYPACVRGGRYLRDSGPESGCYAASLVQETDKSGNDVQRNHLIAYFVQLDDLERWTRSHPTHLAIFGRFLALLEKIGHMPAVNLYHEVSVIPDGNLTATYVNRLPGTGLLRLAASALKAERTERRRQWRWIDFTRSRDRPGQAALLTCSRAKPAVEA